MKKYTNAVIYRHKDAYEILVDKGVIKAIGRNLGQADEVIDLGGKLVAAPYVDPHLHLDYVYTLSELGQSGAGSGTLFEAIELWPKFKETLTEGMYTFKGGRDLVEEALKMGADVVGGIPHYEPAREYLRHIGTCPEI